MGKGRYRTERDGTECIAMARDRMGGYHLAWLFSIFSNVLAFTFRVVFDSTVSRQGKAGKATGVGGQGLVRSAREICRDWSRSGPRTGHEIRVNAKRRLQNAVCNNELYLSSTSPFCLTQRGLGARGCMSCMPLEDNSLEKSPFQTSSFPNDELK